MAVIFGRLGENRCEDSKQRKINSLVGKLDIILEKLLLIFFSAENEVQECNSNWLTNWEKKSRIPKNIDILQIKRTYKTIKTSPKIF